MYVYTHTRTQQGDLVLGSSYLVSYIIVIVKGDFPIEVEYNY